MTRSQRHTGQAEDANRVWRVSRYPGPGEPVSRELFTWSREAIPAIADGEFLVRTLCLATGPAQRGYLHDQPGGFLDPLAIGAVMRGRGVGEIMASRHAEYRPGQIFVGSLGWQDYSVQHPRGADFVYSTKVISEPVRPLSTTLGVLGNAGITAYFGLLDVGAMHAGETVVISAAAGGVGSVAGQIARIRNAGKVIGIAGTDEKCDWLRRSLGFHETVNYRTESVALRLRELCPDGVDVFFDNVGGELLNDVLGHLAIGARIAICGFISTDYDPDARHGPINYRKLVSRRARMQGFVVFDYWDRFAEAEADLQSWFRHGSLVNCEDITEGLEHMPDALASLFTGENRGIKICRVAPDP